MTILFIIILTAISPTVSAACNFTASPVLESEIPTSYTQEQETAKSTLFSKILTLIAGTEQMSNDEFCSLNDEFSSYTNEQKLVSDLIFRETWILIEGSAQMSQAEYDALVIKYTAQVEETQNTTQKTTEEVEEEIIEEVVEEIVEEIPEETTEEILSFIPSDNTQQTEQASEEEKIVLNPSSSSPITTKQGKTRLWIVYAFTAFTILIIILIALRKL